jgi:hypothetical protein
MAKIKKMLTPGQVSSGGGALAAQKSPSELLAPLESLCLYRIEDWWTYELCYARRQRCLTSIVF